jgi:hypothetical protein
MMTFIKQPLNQNKMTVVEFLIGIAVFIVGGCVGAYILLWLLFGKK